MTLNKMIEVADKAYPDGMIGQYWDSKCGEVRQDRDNKIGDTLAKFIVLELVDTFNAEATDREQIAEALRVLRSAKRELSGVEDAFVYMELGIPKGQK